jgi:universal stress protein E
MPDPIRTIVAGVAQASEDDPVLRAAAELAEWTGATLHLVHTFQIPPVIAPIDIGYAAGEWIANVADDLLPLLEAAARRVAPGVKSVCSVVVGPPALAILTAAREADADLLVVGTGRGGRLARAFLGTTAQRVLRGAEVPVLVVRTPVRRPLERVLLTTDLSEFGAALHRRGVEAVGATFGQPEAVRSLHVVATPPLPAPVPRDAMQARMREALDRFVADLESGTVAIEPVVRVGEPAEEIVAEAERWKADLLVVGTHARGWAARLVLGSVAEASLRDASCNVLAIPPSSAEEPDSDDG